MLKKKKKDRFVSFVTRRLYFPLAQQHFSLFFLFLFSFQQTRRHFSCLYLEVQFLSQKVRHELKKKKQNSYSTVAVPPSCGGPHSLLISYSVQRHELPCLQDARTMSRSSTSNTVFTSKLPARSTSSTSAASLCCSADRKRRFICSAVSSLSYRGV